MNLVKNKQITNIDLFYFRRGAWSPGSQPGHGEMVKFRNVHPSDRSKSIDGSPSTIAINFESTPGQDPPFATVKASRGMAGISPMESFRAPCEEETVDNSRASEVRRLTGRLIPGAVR